METTTMQVRDHIAEFLLQLGLDKAQELWFDPFDQRVIPRHAVSDRRADLYAGHFFPLTNRRFQEICQLLERYNPYAQHRFAWRTYANQEAQEEVDRLVTELTPWKPMKPSSLFRVKDALRGEIEKNMTLITSPHTYTPTPTTALAGDASFPNRSKLQQSQGTSKKRRIQTVPPKQLRRSRLKTLVQSDRDCEMNSDPDVLQHFPQFYKLVESGARTSRSLSSGEQRKPFIV
ncbi:hypothetical protein FGO68_gene14194 [Halteria grandinella]|uniref:Uncharacterized protein n=1 Tax=Halteria grandinella TaxID=5974 RepID=A0A8J8NK28_HALGN|nr:hypothetical protein FGO68_gene14194 [Halteria grandinella]